MRTVSALREVHIGKVILDAARQRSIEQEILPERLVLLKLQALPALYRQGNFARVAYCENDVQTLMQQYGIDPDPLLAELKDHLSSTDLEALRKITDEMRQRIARFGQELQ